MEPLWDNLKYIRSLFSEKDKEHKQLNEMVESQKLVVCPLAYIRGRSLSNVFFIVDEAQNVTDEQMSMVISRLCNGSKMVIVGDTSQIDLKNKKDSGMFFLAKQVAGTVPGVASVSLKTNHRHPIVESVLAMYKEI